jgi:hypothetical protein
VRGLLCAGCNAALGHFNDSVEALWAALRYLQAGKADSEPTTAAPISRLTIVSDDRTRRVHFRGAVTVRVDGYVVQIPQGQTKVVMSSPGNYEVI